MRICCYNLTAGIKTGGLETFTWGLATALQQRGHEIEVVAGTGPVTSPVPGVRLQSFAYTERERFPDLGTRFRKMCERLSFARHAYPYVRDGGFDAVLVNKPYDFAVLWRLKRAGYAGVTCYNSGGTEFYRGDRWLAKAVDLWLPCSEHNAAKVHGHYACPYTVLHNGVDTGLFQPEGERVDLHARFAIPESAPVVISVGRLIGLKGLQVIVAALTRVAGLHYVVVGHGQERQRLENLARSEGVAERVHFYGEVKHADLPAVLRGADYFVQPSIGEEAFGISVAEAMAVGLPALASDGWGLREVIRNGETGRLVTPGDPQAWAQALQNLMAEPEAARALGRAARAAVVQDFTWNKAAETFERRVQEVLRNRRGDAG